MKYRKKPVIIEAFQYNGNLKNSKGEWYIPDWAMAAFENGTMYYDLCLGSIALFVNTLEGRYIISVGDYVIKGVQGELYPCKPDIFEATYEIVE